MTVREEANPAAGIDADSDSPPPTWDELKPSRELCAAFSNWHFESMGFHDHVVAFALEHKQELLDVPAGEHSHKMHELHKKFSEKLESFVGEFLAQHGATEDTFVAAMQAQQKSGDLATRMTVEVATDEMLALAEYGAFHQAMVDAVSSPRQTRTPYMYYVVHTPFLSGAASVFRLSVGSVRAQLALEVAGDPGDQTAEAARALLEALAVKDDAAFA
eukprot:SAG22_NODE_6487_length_848_cov_1.216288_1_plen_216_part_01